MTFYAQVWLLLLFFKWFVFLQLFCYQRGKEIIIEMHLKSTVRTMHQSRMFQEEQRPHPFEQYSQERRVDKTGRRGGDWLASLCSHLLDTATIFPLDDFYSSRTGMRYFCFKRNNNKTSFSWAGTRLLFHIFCNAFLRKLDSSKHATSEVPLMIHELFASVNDYLRHCIVIRLGDTLSNSLCIYCSYVNLPSSPLSLIQMSTKEGVTFLDSFI